MKKYISLLLAVLVTAFTVSAFALAPPPKPDNGWYVVDQANKLSEDQKKALNTKIDGINKNTKNEFGVLLIQTLDGDNIEDFAQNTFRSWGIGKAGLNNGVLLVISVGDRKTRLQTGKGAEGDLPDLRAKDILDNLKPFLRKGDFAGGINSTIDATSSFLESRGSTPVSAKTETSSPPVPLSSSAAEPASSDGSGFGIFLLVLLLGGGVIGLIAFFVNRSNRKEQEAVEARAKLQRKAWQAEAAEAELERKRQRDLADRTARERAVKAEREAAIAPIPVSSASSYGSYQPSTSSTAKTSPAIPKAAIIGTAAVVGAGAAAAALARIEEAKKRQKREDEAARQAEADARKRREDDEAAAKRRRDEESSSSYSSYSSSSSSSYDSGSSSSYDSGSSSGGGFGGGDSGGGGASSDW